MTILAKQAGYAVAPRGEVSVLPGKIVRLEPRAAKLRVVAGYGWLSVNGFDTILEPGHSIELPANCRDVPLLSAMANTTLELEFSRS